MNLDCVSRRNRALGCTSCLITLLTHPTFTISGSALARSRFKHQGMGQHLPFSSVHHLFRMEEDLVGLYETGSTKSETMSIEDALHIFGLNCMDCRGKNTLEQLIREVNVTWCASKINSYAVVCTLFWHSHKKYFINLKHTSQTVNFNPFFTKEEGFI